VSFQTSSNLIFKGDIEREREREREREKEREGKEYFSFPISLDAKVIKRFGISSEEINPDQNQS